MSIDEYKIFFPFETSIRQTILNKFQDNSSYICEKESFKDIEGSLKHHLNESNEAYKKGSRQEYRDSIFNIANYLYNSNFPEFYEPFQTYNLFNNLLGVFRQLTCVQIEEQRGLDKDEKDLLIQSLKLLVILSNRNDCCDYLDSIEFFDVIDEFINGSNANAKFCRIPHIDEDYSYLLIDSLANFSAFEEYNSKFTPSLIKYVIAGINSALSPEYYKSPLRFFRNFFLHYDKVKQKDQIKFFLGNLISVIGQFPCSKNLEQNDKYKKIIPSIHHASSVLICILARLGFLLTKEFFQYQIDQFFTKEHYLSYEFLMLSIGYIALNHTEIFKQLEISLDDIFEGLQKDGDFLHYTYTTIYNILTCNKELLKSALIPQIIDLIFNQFEKYDYRAKYCSFILLCYIYRENTSLYVKNVSVVLLLLDNCALFITEEEEANNEILRFLNAFHFFFERCGEIEKYSDLAGSFNNCIEMISNNMEYFDQSLMNDLTPFEMPIE